MSDLIDRQAAIEAIEQMQMPIMRSEFPEEQFVFTGMSEALQAIKDLPSAPPKKVCVAEIKVEIDDLKDYIDKAIEERKTGKWLERHHAYADEEKAIEEWQSCKCSVCGRYDTRPYLYYFSEPRFCSWCGADMRGEGHE